LRSARAAVGFAAAGLLAACSGRERPAAPDDGWEEARVEGLSDASGVAAWGDWLVFTSSRGTSLRAARLADAKDGAALASREVPLEADGEREASFSTPVGVRSFALKHLWDDAPRFSGLSVAPSDLLYVVSESYRLVWLGAIVADGGGAPRRARFERAFELPGARRPRTDRSDWHDYAGDGDAQPDDGVSGIAVSGEDLLGLERGRGAAQAMAYLVDRIAGTPRGFTSLPFDDEDAPGSRWLSDAARDGSGYLVALVRGAAGGAAETRILRVARVETRDLASGGAPTDLLHSLPEPDAARAVTGLAVAGGRLWLVSGGPGPALLRWRAHR
jgi:hypothetical protein